MYADSSEFVVLQFLLPSLAASYLASVACRVARSLHYSVRWWLGFLGTVLAALALFSFVAFSLSLQPGEDSYGTGRFLLFVCIAGSSFAVVPAEIVVLRYRRAFTKVEHVA
jgi:hypothetical protein